MSFFEFLAAFFYLQPSLVITFVPIQIFALFFILRFYKNPILKSILHAFGATLFAALIIFLIGCTIIPFAHLSFLQSLKISFVQSSMLIFISAFVYGCFTYVYLQYLFKIRSVRILSLLSSAIAGASVLGLYYLWWR